MQIDRIVCSEDIAGKLESKHNVKPAEAEEVLLNQPRIRFAEKGHTEGDDVYVAFGQTFAGRFLSVFLYLLKKRGETGSSRGSLSTNDIGQRRNKSQF